MIGVTALLAPIIILLEWAVRSNYMSLFSALFILFFCVCFVAQSTGRLIARQVLATSSMMQGFRGIAWSLGFKITVAILVIVTGLIIFSAR